MLDQVYPNPANDYYVIEYMIQSTEKITDKKIELYNIQGELLESIPVAKYYDQVVMRCKHYHSGIFACVLKINGQEKASMTFIISQ